MPHEKPSWALEGFVGCKLPAINCHMTIKIVKPKLRPLYPDFIQAGECMGEIRVDVNMFNAVDEGVARRGGIPESEIRRSVASALVDTGAIRCCIPLAVAQQLGLGVLDRTVATFADGRQQIVDVTEPIRFEIAGRSTVQLALVLGDEVLLGQLALEDTDLWADCKGRRLVPNPAHPNQPTFPVK
jgi:clan AA aspartic protease